MLPLLPLIGVVAPLLNNIVDTLGGLAKHAIDNTTDKMKSNTATPPIQLPSVTIQNRISF